MRDAAPEGAEVPTTAEECDLLSLALFKLDRPEDTHESDWFGHREKTGDGFRQTIASSSIPYNLKTWLNR